LIQVVYSIFIQGSESINPKELSELHEYYKRLVLYEFSLNKRDENFIKEANEVFIIYLQYTK
jgi:hypothetical protein